MHLKNKQAKNTITFRCVEAPAAPRSKQWHHGKEMILLLDSPASRVTASLITSDEAGQQHLEFLGSVASNGQDPMATPVQDQPRESQCPHDALCMISLHIYARPTGKGRCWGQDLQWGGVSQLGTWQSRALQLLWEPRRTRGDPGDSGGSLWVGRVLPAELLAGSSQRNMFSSQRFNLIPRSPPSESCNSCNHSLPRLN